MSELVTGLKSAKALLAFFKNRTDPGKRRYLADVTETFFLEELPRIHSIIQERINDVADSRCSVEEVLILSEQVFEEQRRTADATKRRRLSSVLINGLCAKPWDKATHRMMIRLASNLEEEHVEHLRRMLFGLTNEQREALRQERERAREEQESQDSQRNWKEREQEQQARWRQRQAREAVEVGLLRELIAAV